MSSHARGVTAPIWLLMAMVVICQFGLAIYLPSIGAMRLRFQASPTEMQLLLSGYLALFAVTQLVLGPLADRYGRRQVLLVAFCLYGVASLACAAAPNFATLVAARMLQGIGACAGAMLPRAIIRDTLSGPASVKAMSRIAAAGALSPALSPLIGGQLQVHLDWWASFLFTGSAALGLTAVAWCLLPETGQVTGRGSHWLGLLRGFRQALGQPRFLGYTLNMVGASIAFYFFISAAPELLIERRGVPVDAFGWFTLAWAGSFVIGSLVSGRLAARLGGETLVLAGVAALTIGALAMAAAGAGGATHLASFVGPLMLMGAGNGLTMPSSLSGAMAAVPATIGGAAAAITGVAQVGGGAVLTALAGRWHLADQTTLGLAIAATGAISLGAFFLLSRAPRP